MKMNCKITMPDASRLKERLSYMIQTETGGGLFSIRTSVVYPSGGSGFSVYLQEIAELEPNTSVSTDGLTISRTVMENTIVNWLETFGMKIES